MARINAILKINELGNGILETFYSNQNSNNVSYTPYSNSFLEFINNTNISNKTYGATGTLFGLTNTIGDLRFGVVDNNGVRSENYKGMMLGYTNNSNIFLCELIVTGQDIIDFKIIFDNLLDQYPTDYSWTDIDGVTHNVSGNTSNEIEFTQRAGYGTITINFSVWNKPNTIVAITYIENIETDIPLGKSEIINFETQVQKTSQPDKLQYGIIANTGKILLKDTNKQMLYRYANLGYLNAQLFSLDFYVNNNKIQEHISNQSPYFTDNSEIQLELTNIVEKWSSIEIPETNFSGSSLYDVLLNVMQQYDNDLTQQDVDDMLDQPMIAYQYYLQIYIDTTVINWLKGIYILPFTLKADSFINQLKKICTVAMLQCYINDEGNLKFVSARPLHSFVNDTDRKIIQIPYKYQTKSLEYDILFLNRYEEVEIK